MPMQPQLQPTWPRRRGCGCSVSSRSVCSDVPHATAQAITAALVSAIKPVRFDHWFLLSSLVRVRGTPWRNLGGEAGYPTLAQG